MLWAVPSRSSPSQPGSPGLAAWLESWAKWQGYQRLTELLGDLGLDANLASQWRGGHRTPTRDQFRQLAAALSLPVRSLLVTAGVWTAEEMGAEPFEPQPPPLDRAERVIMTAKTTAERRATLARHRAAGGELDSNELAILEMPDMDDETRAALLIAYQRSRRRH